MALAYSEDVSLRISADTEGGSQVGTLASQIEALAKQGGDAAPEFARLAEELRKVDQQQVRVQGLQEAIAGAKSAYSEFQKARTTVEQLDNALAQARGANASRESIKALEKQLKAAEREANKTERAWKKQKTALDGARKSAADAGVDYRNLEGEQKRLASQADSTAQEFLKLQSAVEPGRQGLDELGASAGTVTERLNSVKGSVLAASASLSAITLVLGNAAKESGRFQQGMAEVSTLLDDTSSMDELTETVRALSREFGGDVNANAKALYDIISAGATDAAQATEILTAANKLAIGGVTDVKVAADGLTSIMNAYGPAAGEARDVSDALFTAMRAGKTTIEQLSGSLGQVAPLASEAGVGLEELLAATAAITKGGVGTSQAVTQLRGAISNIIKPSKQATDLAEELGLQFDAASLKSKGLAGFLQDVAEKTGGSTEKMTQLFGSVEALNAVLALTGSQAESFAAIIDDMGDRAGATEDAVGKMMDTPAARAARFSAAMKDVRLSLGDAVTAFSPLLEAATTALNTFNELPGPLKATAAGVAALSVAIPAVSLAVRQLSGAWAILTASVATSTTATTANTAATVANTAAVRANGLASATAAAQVKTLATAKAGLSAVLTPLAAGTANMGMLLRGLGWGAVAYQVFDITKNLIALRDEINNQNQALANLDENQGRMATRLAEISEATGLTITSMEEFNAAVADGSIVFDEAAARWVLAGSTLADVAASAGDATAASLDMAKVEWGQQIRQAGELADKLDAAARESKNAAAGVADVLKELDLLDPASVVTVAQAMGMLKSTGSEAAGVLNQELRKALIDLSDVDLTALEQSLVQAFEAGKISAEDFASAVGVVADETAKRVEDAFRTLGVTSQRSLDQAANQAREAFERIRASGTASTQDIERAFEAYARRAVAANQGVVSEALKAEARMLGLKIEADAAGRVIVESMTRAANATGNVGREADRSADSIRRLADETLRLRNIQGGGGGGGGGGVGVIDTRPRDDAGRLSKESGDRVAGMPLLNQLTALYDRAEQIGGIELRRQLEAIYKREADFRRLPMSWTTYFKVMDKVFRDQERAIERFQKNQDEEERYRREMQPTGTSTTSGRGSGASLGTVTINIGGRSRQIQTTPQGARELEAMLRELESSMGRAT